MVAKYSWKWTWIMSYYLNIRLGVYLAIRVFQSFS